MAVLYLGNLDFAGKGAVGDSTVADAKIADPSTTAVIARLLSIQPTELENAICIQNINAGGEWIKSPNSIAYLGMAGFVERHVLMWLCIGGTAPFSVRC